MAVETIRLEFDYREKKGVACTVQVDLPDYPVYAYDPDERHAMVMWCSGSKIKLEGIIRDRNFRRQIERTLKHKYHMPVKFSITATPRDREDWEMRF